MSGGNPEISQGNDDSELRAAALETHASELLLQAAEFRQKALELRSPEIAKKIIEIRHQLLQSNIPVHIIPGNVYPGLEVVTPYAISKADASEYSPQSIYGFVDQGRVSGFQLGRSYFLDLLGVIQLLNRREQNMAKQVIGPRPGRRKP